MNRVGQMPAARLHFHWQRLKLGLCLCFKGYSIEKPIVVFANRESGVKCSLLKHPELASVCLAETGNGVLNTFNIG